ncbi:MAG: hypothetical protein QM758_06670 [Armatimonas sp.]
MANIKVALLVSLVVVGAFTGYKILAAPKPIRKIAADVPDAAVVGNPKQTEEECRALLNKMKSVGWDWKKLKQDDFHFSGLKNCEDKDIREGRGMPLMAYPGSEQVAFANFLYIRENAEVYEGDNIIKKPSGFYVVAWKNGDITRVPIEDTRLARVPGTAGYRVVFPGMKEYDAGNPRHFSYGDKVKKFIK